MLSKIPNIAHIVLHVILTVFMYLYPIGDWVSGWVLRDFYFVPVIIIHLIMFFYRRMKNKGVVLQSLISVLSILLVIHYIRVH